MTQKEDRRERERERERETYFLKHFEMASRPIVPQQPRGIPLLSLFFLKIGNDFSYVNMRPFLGFRLKVCLLISSIVHFCLIPIC